ncbi:MAG: hypothetical protein OEM28_08980 [Nitrosopumilus sp.]|nr:hypothetical protein [Nitrosopumilus sp.]MDH3488247.1 hypothetical protein [Nitrosopumilus sp.]
MTNKCEESTDETLIKLLTEKSTRKIISLLQDIPKSPSEMIQKCNFSINLLHSRIDALDNFHLLYVSEEIDKNGKRKFYYQSKIKSFNLRFVDGKTHLEMIYNRTLPKK